MLGVTGSYCFAERLMLGVVMLNDNMLSAVMPFFFKYWNEKLLICRVRYHLQILPPDGATTFSIMTRNIGTLDISTECHYAECDSFVLLC